MRHLLNLAWNKIFILLTVIIIGVWQSYAYIQEELEHKNKMIEHEVDLSIYRINQQLLIERSLMEPIVNNLKKSSFNQLSDPMLRDVLKIHFNKNDYIYSLWLMPDRIINGIDQVNPRELERFSFTAYGDDTHYVKPFYDQERSALYMPIYRGIYSEGVQKALLYKEVNLSNLIRDLSRLNQKYGGTGLLINDSKELIHLLTAAKITSAEANTLLTKIEGLDKIGQETLIKDGEITIIRAIGNSNWYFIYYEDSSMVLGYTLLKYLFAASVLMVIVILSYREAIKKAQMNQQNQASNMSLGQDQDNDILLQWLKAEVEQINRLKTFNGTDVLIAFKYDVITSLVEEKDLSNQIIHTREFMKWVKTLKVKSDVLDIEESTDSHGFSIPANLLNLMISTVLLMLDSKLEGNVIVKFDSSSSMAVFNLYGDISRILGTIHDHHQDSIKLMSEPLRIHSSVLGNRLIVALHQEQRLMPMNVEGVIATEEKKYWNGSLYLLEDDVEENLILKFYLDKLNISLKFCRLYEKLPSGSILLMSKRIQEEMANHLEMYESERIHLVLYGDTEAINDHENILITRPYSIEKIQHVLSLYSGIEER